MIQSQHIPVKVIQKRIALNDLWNADSIANGIVLIPNSDSSKAIVPIQAIFNQFYAETASNNCSIALIDAAKQIADAVGSGNGSLAGYFNFQFYDNNLQLRPGKNLVAYNSAYAGAVDDAGYCLITVWYSFIKVEL